LDPTLRIHKHFVIKFFSHDFSLDSHSHPPMRTVGRTEGWLLRSQVRQ
jgi:hypothetical protein